MKGGLTLPLGVFIGFAKNINTHFIRSIGRVRRSKFRIQTLSNDMPRLTFYCRLPLSGEHHPLIRNTDNFRYAVLRFLFSHKHDL
jgi:hypothetical protein